jgi:hypothetical protein
MKQGGKGEIKKSETRKHGNRRPPISYARTRSTEKVSSSRRKVTSSS